MQPVRYESVLRPCRTAPGQQTVQTLALFGNDLQAFGILSFPVKIPLENSRRAGDTGERIPYLMCQAGGQLSERKEPFGAFHLFKIVLQLPVNLREPLGGTFQIGTLFSSALRQRAGQDTSCAEEGKIQYLIDGVVRQLRKTQKVMRSIREARDNSHEHAASPAGAESGEDDRQIVQVLKDIVPVQHREWYDQMEDANQQNAADHPPRDAAELSIASRKIL
jgi:hypothetical protein